MLLRAALGWSALALLACGGPEPVDADAGLDAGRDAGVDAGHDAGVDGGHDAGVDGGHDAGPTDPGWEPWVTLAEECVIERARYPERMRRMAWDPCEEQPVGCLRVRGRRVGTPPAYFDRERGRGYFQRAYEEFDGGPVVYSVVPTEGPVVAAWRVPPFAADGTVCAVDIGLAVGDAAVVVDFVDFNDRSRDVQWLYRAALEEIGTVDEPLAQVIPRVRASSIDLSSELTVLRSYTLQGFDATGRQVWIDRGMPGLPQSVHVVGSHVFWEDWADLVRIAHGGMDTPASFLRRVDPGDTKGFRTDGQELVWLEGYDRQPDRFYARLELWAAPYTEDLAALEARMVRTMVDHSTPSYGDGWYVVSRVGPPRWIEIVDTADGSLREWPTSSATRVLYVSENELLFVGPGGLTRLDPHTLPIVAE